MARFRLESYAGRSMEFGPDGIEGLRRSEASRNMTDEELNEEEKLKIQEALAEVPGGNDEVHVPTISAEHSYIDETWGHSNHSASYDASRAEHDDSALEWGDSDFEDFMREIVGDDDHPHAGSMNMCDMAHEITKGPDVPTYKEVFEVDEELFPDEMNRDERKREDEKDV